MPGYQTKKERLKTRLRRIEGQVRGIERMVDEDAYCIDVLTQVAAAARALQAVGLALMDEHLAHCVADAAARGGAERTEKLNEAVEAIRRLLRS